METKKFEPSFQMIANTIQKMELENSIINISDAQDLHRSFSVDAGEINIEEHGEYKSAGLDVTVRVVIEEKKSDAPKKFALSLTVAGVFIDAADTPDDAFKNKLKVNGTAALYSVARGCITNISSQALAEGKVVLPLVNFMAASNETKAPQ